MLGALKSTPNMRSASSDFEIQTPPIINFNTSTRELVDKDFRSFKLTVESEEEDLSFMSDFNLAC